MVPLAQRHLPGCEGSSRGKEVRRRLENAGKKLPRTKVWREILQREIGKPYKLHQRSLSRYCKPYWMDIIINRVICSFSVWRTAGDCSATIGKIGEQPQILVLKNRTILDRKFLPCYHEKDEGKLQFSNISDIVLLPPISWAWDCEHFWSNRGLSWRQNHPLLLLGAQSARFSTNCYPFAVLKLVLL